GAHGVEPGDRVALWLGNREETVLAYLAALRLGAVAVPLNLAYRRQELAHVLADAAPRLLLTERDQLAVLDEVGHDVLGEVPLRLVEDLAPQAARTTSASLAPLPRSTAAGDDLALLLYTSGTTGRSKGAM